MLRILLLGAGIALAVPLILAVMALRNPVSDDPRTARQEIAGIVDVVDADTLDVGGTRVRLFGIDAPEWNQTCEAEGADWACGAWATDQARLRFEGQEARCVAVDRDRYGRVVARCFVKDQDIGRQLVQEGVAFAYRRYSMDYDLDEKAALVGGRGLHRADRVSRPALFRKSQDEEASRDVSSEPVRLLSGQARECDIKGNVSGRSGERIYHVPGQRHYDRTRISEAKGERYFCSEEEARLAGWRPSLR